MQASVKIMDIDVDMLSNDVFIQKINEYLTDEKLQVIFFASTEVLNRAVEEEEYRRLVDMAELFLPGEEALLSNHHVDVLEAGQVVAGGGVVLGGLAAGGDGVHRRAAGLEREGARQCQRVRGAGCSEALGDGGHRVEVDELGNGAGTLAVADHEGRRQHPAAL